MTEVEVEVEVEVGDDEVPEEFLWVVYEID